MSERTVVLLGAENVGKQTLIYKLKERFKDEYPILPNASKFRQGFVTIENTVSLIKENNKREREMRQGMAKYLLRVNRIILVVDTTQDLLAQEKLFEHQWSFLKKKPKSVFILFTKRDVNHPNQLKLHRTVESLRRKLDCQVVRMDISFPDNQQRLQNFVEVIERDQLKQAIQEAFGEYISWWKICFFGTYGHHHNSRAKAVRNAISRGLDKNDTTLVANILANQIAIMDGNREKANETATLIPKEILGDYWTDINCLVHAKTKRSGYYSCLLKANNALTPPKKQNCSELFQRGNKR